MATSSQAGISIEGGKEEESQGHEAEALARSFEHNAPLPHTLAKRLTYLSLPSCWSESSVYDGTDQLDGEQALQAQKIESSKTEQNNTASVVEHLPSYGAITSASTFRQWLTQLSQHEARESDSETAAVVHTLSSGITACDAVCEQVCFLKVSMYGYHWCILFHPE